MMWDLYALDGISLSNLTKMTLTALKVVPSDANYRDWIGALLIADQSLNSQSNCQTIYNRAIERGLGSNISNISCSNISTEVFNQKSSPQAPPQSSASSDTDCGVLGGSGYGPTLLWILILPILIPFLGGRTS